MSRKKHYPLPPRKRISKEQIRADYIKGLEQRPTSDTLEETKYQNTGSTAYLPYNEEEIPRPIEAKRELNLKKISIYVSICVGVASLIGVIFWMGYYYRDIEYLKKQILELKQKTENDIQHTNERIDRYLTKEKE